MRRVENQLTLVCAGQLHAVSAERDGLYEDLINHRTSKRTVEQQWRKEREKSEHLESELAFYQNHSARALSDRDQVCFIHPGQLSTPSS